ncbi:MAG TPA: antibiotic biosynthesis monooxygenase family protein [Bacteroidota bacterium]|nr:antibiotic biosynthesis monooxygenase family protein [Bacteroidota bacterium]
MDNSRSPQPYTVGTWIVKAGSEQKFIAEWARFARWTAANQPGAGTGTLLQSRDRSQEFISFGPWESADAIRAWRERPEFIAFVSTVRELCDNFIPQSFERVASSD